MIKAIQSSSPIDIPNRTTNTTKKVSEGLAAHSKSTLSTYEEAPLIADLNLMRNSSLSIECACIELIELLAKSGKSLMKDSSDEINHSLKRLNTSLQENARLWQEAALKEESMGVFALLQRVGASFFAAFNIGLGTSLMTAGAPAVGAALVGAGVLASVNLAMGDIKGWDFVANKLSGEDEELKKRLSLYIPMTLQALTGTMSAAVSTGAVLEHLPIPKQELAKLCQEGIGYYKNASMAGVEVRKAQISWIEAKIATGEKIITFEDTQKDILYNWVKELVNLLNKNEEITKELIEIRIRQLEATS